MVAKCLRLQLGTSSALYFVTTNILKESKFTLHVSRLSSRDLRVYPGHTTSLQKQNSELVNP